MRVAMPRKLIKRYMPDPEKVRGNQSLRFLAPLLHDPNLWHLNRHSVARAMACGLFAAFIPMPMQMLLSSVLAVWLRGNLPIAVGLVWLTNPVTMPPIFYCTYKLGAWLMSQAPIDMPDELTWAWITGELASVWQPFLLGSALSGLVFAVASYFLTHWLWRLHVAHSWRQRQLRRQRSHS